MTDKKNIFFKFAP